MNRGDRNRVLHYAILASLALHAVLLLSLPDLISGARHAASLPPKIIARLMAPEPIPVPAPPPQPPPQAAPAVPPPQPKKKPPAPVLAKPAPERPVQVEPSRAPQPPVPPAPVAEPAPVPAKPAEEVVTAAPAAPAPAAPPVASAQMLEEQSADRYRMELIAALARTIKDSYPPQARDNNWEGDVLLGVVVRPNGNVSINVKRGSRFRVLDQGAVAALRQATQEVPVPPALRGKESPLKDLLVQYRLTD
ncbi:MAG TPA: TonB family protein [Burkholderiales bacterium]|nr:TonB family protein [Burkholderiales bacterium]